jgi:hypothetical protein
LAALAVLALLAVLARLALLASGLGWRRVGLRRGA